MKTFSITSMRLIEIMQKCNAIHVHEMSIIIQVLFQSYYEKKVNAHIKIGIRDNCALPFIHSYKLDTAKYSEKEKHVMT